MSHVVVLEVEQIWGPKIFQCEMEDMGDGGRGQGTSRSRCWMSCPYICWLQPECLLRFGIEWKNGPTASVPGEYRRISGRPRDDSDRKAKVTLIGVHWFFYVSKGAGIWRGLFVFLVCCFCWQESGGEVGWKWLWGMKKKLALLYQEVWVHALQSAQAATRVIFSSLKEPGLT